MKKLNNKGVTMIELIITIALISVIMVFLYSLLSNITFESDNEFIDITDRSIREDIIRTINDNLNDYNKNNTNKLKSASYGNATSSTDGYIYICTTEGTCITPVYKLLIKKDTYDELTFMQGSTIIQKWKLEEGTFDNYISGLYVGSNEILTPSCKTIGNTASANGILLTTCTIRVYTSNLNNKIIEYQTPGATTTYINNNNILDDIMFEFGTI